MHKVSGIDCETQISAKNRRSDFALGPDDVGHQVAAMHEEKAVGETTQDAANATVVWSPYGGILDEYGVELCN